MRKWLLAAALAAVVAAGCQSGEPRTVIAEPGDVHTGKRLKDMVATELPPKWLDKIGFRKAWEFDFHKPIRNVWYISIRDGLHRLYVETADNALYRLDPRDGRTMWKQGLRAPLAYKPYVYIYERESNRPPLARKLEGVSDYQEAIQLINEESKRYPELYIVVGNRLVCLNDNSGEEVWSRHTTFGLSSRPFASFSHAFLTSHRQRLYAISKKDQTTDWDRLMDGDLTGSGSSRGSHVFLGDEGGNIYCLNASSGNVVWRTHALGRVTSEPDTRSLRLILGSWDGYVYCLEMETGFVRWKFAAQDPVERKPVVIDNIVYAATSRTARSSLFALSIRKRGKLLWRLPNGKQVLLQGRPTHKRRYSYVLDNRGYVCCVVTESPVEAEVGGIRWRRRFRDVVDFFITNDTDKRSVKREYARYHIYLATKSGRIVALEEMAGF